MADQNQATLAADIHDKAVIQAALAVLGGTRRHWSKVADAVEALNKQLVEIEGRINGRRLLRPTASWEAA